MDCLVHFTYCGAILDVAVRVEPENLVRHQGVDAEAVKLAMLKLDRIKLPFINRTWLKHLDLSLFKVDVWKVPVNEELDVGNWRMAANNTQTMICWKETMDHGGIHFLSDLSYADRGLARE